MNRFTSAIVIAIALISLALPVAARADEQQDLKQKIDQLTRDLDALKQQLQQNEAQTKKVDEQAKAIEDLKQQLAMTEKKSLGRWLTIGGDYRFRVDNMKGDVTSYADGMTLFGNAGALVQGMQTGAIPPMDQQTLFGAAMMGGTYGNLTLPSAMQNPYGVSNDSLYTNRFGLNLKAKATDDVTVTARLLMYKVAGAQDDRALQSGNTAYSLDRAGLFDGTIGHVPGDSKLAVDRAYATWNNIGGQPIWFSIGRRPSTGGAPSHYRQDLPAPGVSGVPALLVDYAFDGVSLGWAPEIERLPGASAKFCYGRGYQSEIERSDTRNAINNTDMIGIDLVAIDTDPFRAQFQYNRGIDIFDAPIMLSGPFPLEPGTNLGDIDWFSVDLMGMKKKLGPGNLNWFASLGQSQTHPNGNTLRFAGLDSGYGLLFTGVPEDNSGWAAYAGARYDFRASRTKIGFEYNHGSKDWITFAPAADDMWTSKVGARGNVYEAYVIKELPLKPVSSYSSVAFFKFGYQYYDFDYSGSNSWLGAPIELDTLTNMTPQLTAPMKNAKDFYATFEVHF